MIVKFSPLTREAVDCAKAGCSRHPKSRLLHNKRRSIRSRGLHHHTSPIHTVQDVPSGVRSLLPLRILACPELHFKPALGGVRSCSCEGVARTTSCETMHPASARKSSTRKTAGKATIRRSTRMVAVQYQPTQRKRKARLCEIP